MLDLVRLMSIVSLAEELTIHDNECSAMAWQLRFRTTIFLFVFRLSSVSASKCTLEQNAKNEFTIINHFHCKVWFSTDVNVTLLLLKSFTFMDKTAPSHREHFLIKFQNTFFRGFIFRHWTEQWAHFIVCFTVFGKYTLLLIIIMIHDERWEWRARNETNNLHNWSKIVFVSSHQCYIFYIVFGGSVRRHRQQQIQIYRRTRIDHILINNY